MRMGMFVTFLIVYYMVINVMGYMIMGADKQRAIHKQRRIPERTMFRLALAGGAIGIYIGMKHFRHKTQHATFIWGIPLIGVIHGSVIVALMNGSV